MKKNHFVLWAVLSFLIGGFIGAGLTYHFSKCNMHQTSIHLDDGSKNGAGITIKTTGDKN